VRFDYLHSPKPMLVARILEVRVPERFHSALFALAGALAVVAGAWGIDAYRLREALRIQAVYQQHFDQADSALKQTDVYYGRVRTIVDLDRRVREIAASGDSDARTLAEIANGLPQHAWLTGISHDAGGLALDGRAKDLSVVSRVIYGLMQTRDLRSPSLVSVAADNEHGLYAGMKYEIHVDGAAQ